MLATTSIGATWASCGSELGVQAVIDRFGQIAPKVLFTVDGYLYKNKPFSLLPNVKAIVEAIPSIEKVVVIPYVEQAPDLSLPGKSVIYEDFLADDESLVFEQVPFSHPLYIMFSSGTTGKPKCMVQSVGGVLINHLKELIIHADLTSDDTIVYMTAPSWMMWNWLMAPWAWEARSSFSTATLAILTWAPCGNWWTTRRSPFSERAPLTSISSRPKTTGRRTSSTSRPSKRSARPDPPFQPRGSNISYDAIKEDVHFNSLAGGTDINGCFCIGTPDSSGLCRGASGPGVGYEGEVHTMKMRIPFSIGRASWSARRLAPPCPFAFGTTLTIFGIDRPTSTSIQRRGATGTMSNSIAIRRA